LGKIPGMSVEYQKSANTLPEQKAHCKNIKFHTPTRRRR
jgi:hypothetical protein